MWRRRVSVGEQRIGRRGCGRVGWQAAGELSGLVWMKVVCQGGGVFFSLVFVRAVFCLPLKAGHARGRKRQRGGGIVVCLGALGFPPPFSSTRRLPAFSQRQEDCVAWQRMNATSCTLCPPPPPTVAVVVAAAGRGGRGKEGGCVRCDGEDAVEMR
jgi:hypothetical protein